MGYKSWSKLVYAGAKGGLDQETIEFGSFTGFERVPNIWSNGLNCFSKNLYIYVVYKIFWDFLLGPSDHL